MLWFATRATGEIAVALLSAVTVLGIVTSGGWAHPRWPKAVTTGLHRTLTLLAVGFVVVHLATTVLDGYVAVSFRDAVVPFASGYRTFWLGLAAIAFDLLIVLVVTGLLRTRLTLPVWRGLHWTAYACWALATLHGIGAGTDTKLTFVVALTGAGAVGLALVARYGPMRVAVRA